MGTAQEIIDTKKLPCCGQRRHTVNNQLKKEFLVTLLHRAFHQLTSPEEKERKQGTRLND